MTDLSVEIEQLDPLFAFTAALSGSCSEGTKVSSMDEADVLCLFQHSDWKDLHLSTHETDDWTYMRLTNGTIAKKHPKLVTTTNSLSPHMKNLTNCNMLVRGIY